MEEECQKGLCLVLQALDRANRVKPPVMTVVAVCVNLEEVHAYVPRKHKRRDLNWGHHRNHRRRRQTDRFLLQTDRHNVTSHRFSECVCVCVGGESKLGVAVPFR